MLAVSFGCFIHGTTVSYPSVFMPGLEKTNATKNNSSSNSSNSSSGGLFPDTLPFYVYDEDISLMGERTEKFVGKSIENVHCISNIMTLLLLLVIWPVPD